MKVISGKYKGRNLEGFNITGTRPTMDRVKESLFGMLQNYINDRIILDLFAGSGGLAIEGLSQGAKLAYLVDSNNEAIKIINRNLKKLEISAATVIKNDYKKALQFFHEQNLKFDIIFIDPPYKTNYISKSIELISEYNLLSENGLIICESDELDKIIYPKMYNVIKSKRYGDKFIAILQKI